MVAPAPPSPDPPPPAELYDSEAKGQSYFSELSTFAEIKMPKRPRSSRQQVINTMPYFGPFAGRRVTFVVEESRTTVLVDNQPITNRLDFTQGRSGRSIKDRCIAFLHATGRDGAHCEYNVPPPKPPTLKFFCERRIWLSGETPLGMPLAEARKFNQYSKMTLNVNVWPSSVVRAQPMAVGTEKLKISVPVCLSFGELEYFMREALYLQLSLHLREPEGIYPLQPSEPLKPHHTELECFVRVPPVCLTTPRPFLLPISLIGIGTGEVRVTPATTVLELECEIAELFGLQQGDFVYIPALFSSQVRESFGLGMFFSASRRETDAMALINQSIRFPIALNDPTLIIDHHQLSLYHLTLRELGFLIDSPPLVCFCVNGPTVPISFRATANGGEAVNHMRVTMDTRITSINLKWTTSTLLKYVECVSRFPNSKLIHRNTEVPHNQQIEKLFARQWVVNDPRGRRAISPSCIRIV